MQQGRATVAADVAVVIVTYQSARSIGECLASLTDTAPRRLRHVIVVDNASSDATVRRIGESRGSLSLSVIHNAGNRGLAAANNQGIAASDAPIVVISNPDVIFREGAIDQLAACLDRHPDAAFAVAQLEHPDGAPQTSVGDLPTLFESLMGRRWSIGRAAGGITWQPARGGGVERLIGRGQEACYAVRRAAIDAVGPQDERYFLDWEGFEWTRRMREKGWTVWHCPQARVVHLGGVSIRQARVRWIIHSHRGLHRYFAAGRPVAVRAALASVVTMRAILKLLLAAVVDVYGRGHR